MTIYPTIHKRLEEYWFLAAVAQSNPEALLQIKLVKKRTILWAWTNAKFNKQCSCWNKKHWTKRQTSRFAKFLKKLWVVLVHFRHWAVVTGANACRIDKLHKNEKAKRVETLTLCWQARSESLYPTQMLNLWSESWRHLMTEYFQAGVAPCFTLQQMFQSSTDSEQQKQERKNSWERRRGGTGPAGEDIYISCLKRTVTKWVL